MAETLTRKKTSGGRPQGAINRRKAVARKERITGKTGAAHGKARVGRPSELRERTLVERLMTDLTRTDSSDIKHLCQAYGLKRDDLGRLTGFSLRALADWSAGKLPSEPARRRLNEIRRLMDSLATLVPVHEIAPWLKVRNPAFDNMTPLQVIEVGEMDRLWQMVHALGSDALD